MAADDVMFCASHPHFANCKVTEGAIGHTGSGIAATPRMHEAVLLANRCPDHVGQALQK